MAGGLGVIGILIHYGDTAIGGFHRGPASIGNLFHIADIGAVVVTGCGVGFAQAAAHVGHLVAAIGNLVPVDDDVLGFIIGIVGNLDAAIILDGLAGGDRSQVFQFLGQFHDQGIGAVGNDADIAIGEVSSHFHAAVDGGLFIHLSAKARSVCRAIGLDVSSIDLAIIHGGDIVAEPLGILVPQPGGLGFVIGCSNVLTVRQSLVPIMDTGVRLGGFAILILLILVPRINHVISSHRSESGFFIHEDGDVAVFGNAGRQVGRAVVVAAGFIAGLDGDGISQAAFHHFVALVVFAGVGIILGVGGEAQAFGNGIGIVGDLGCVIGNLGGIATHRIGYGPQFIFRSSPSAHIGGVFNGPFFVGQARYIVPGSGMTSGGLSVLNRR